MPIPVENTAAMTAIRVAMWVPFAIVFLISALVFCRAGYKRGLWRALVSLGSTIVAALLSLLLASLLGRPLSRGILSALMGSSDDLATARLLVEAAVQTIMALCIFSLLLFILVIVGKKLSDRYLKKYMMTDNQGMRWGGLGVRLADALLYTLLLLLPLYGTIATYLPVVQSALESTALAGETADADEGDQQETRMVARIVSEVLNHPVTKLSSGGPVSLFYEGLSTVQTDRGELNIAAAVDSLNGTIQRMEALAASAQDGTLDPEQVQELMHYLRENVIRQEWCYTGCMSLVDLVTQQPELAEYDEVRKLVELASMSREDFITNADALLEFGEYILQEDVYTVLMNSEDPLQALEETGVLAKWGQTINATEQAVGCRQLVVQLLLRNSRISNPAIRRLVLNAWGGEPTQDPELQLRQARSFLLLLTMSARYPLDLLTSTIGMSDAAVLSIRHYVMTAPLQELLPNQVSYSDYDGYDVYVGSVPGAGMAGTEDGSVLVGMGATSGEGMGSAYADTGSMVADGEVYSYVSVTGANGEGFGGLENPEGTLPEEACGWALYARYLGGEEALRQWIWEAIQEAAKEGCTESITGSLDAFLNLTRLGVADDVSGGYLGGSCRYWPDEAYFQWLTEQGELTDGALQYTILTATSEVLEQESKVGEKHSLWELARAVELMASGRATSGEFQRIMWMSADDLGLQVAQKLNGALGRDPLGLGAKCSQEDRSYIRQVLTEQLEEAPAEILIAFLGL